MQGLDPLTCEERTVVFGRVAADSPSGTAELTVTMSHSTEGDCGPVATATSIISTSIGVDEMLNLRFANVTDSDEIDPGGYLALNDDDDNNNQLPDKDEPGPVAGEDDLQPLLLVLSPLADPAIVVRLDGVAGGTPIRLYRMADKTDLVSLPLIAPAGEFPSVLYVEGVAVSQAVRDIELVGRYFGDEDDCDDRLRMTVVELELESVTINSDHGLLRDNNLNYEPIGTLFGEPEWRFVAPLRDYPVSHTMDLPVTLSWEIRVTPGGVSDLPCRLLSTGPQGFNVDETALLDGGLQAVMVTSTDVLEKRIWILSPIMEWRIVHDGRTFHRRASGPHTMYVTVGTPRDTALPQHVVTMARMERAVIHAGAPQSLNPHEIVEWVIGSQGNFQLLNPRDNAWDVPEFGGDCQSIVRFAGKVAKMVNIAGTFAHKNIYAIEDLTQTPVFDPAVAIEGDPPAGLNNPVRFHPTQSQWSLSLVDFGSGCNAFEAVAKFTACGQTMYYPGGVPWTLLDNKDDVLKVFQSLSWIEWVNGVCTVRQNETLYPAIPPNPTIQPCP